MWGTSSFLGPNLLGLLLATTLVARAQTPPPAAEPDPPPPPAAPAEATPPAAPVTAPAAPAVPIVTVVARDGATFTGEMLERIPNQYVTVRLATGELRRIAWAFIARIDGDPVPLVPKTRVAFRADHEEAMLEEYVNGEWVSLCRTPCKGEVRQGETLRVGGPKVVPSDPFKVTPGREQMQIDAEATSRSQRIWGVVLGVGGGGILLVGSTVFAIGASNDGKVEENGETRYLTDSERRDFRATGGVMMVVGAAAGITGLIMLLQETEVRVSKHLPGVRPKRATAKAKGIQLTASGFRF